MNYFFGGGGEGGEGAGVEVGVAAGISEIFFYKDSGK